MLMNARSYGQSCPVARGLDVIGERWTLLIVRELLLGPKRFKDLLAELPAMGTNRLSDRLRRLEEDGVVERQTLPPPGEARVYVLTADGERLRSIVVSVAAWGIDRPVDPSIGPDSKRSATIALVLCGLAPRELTLGISEIYEFRIEDTRFHILANDGALTPRSGPAPIAADVTVECDLPTLAQLVAGKVSATLAKREGRARISGTSAAVRRVFAILSMKHLAGDVRLVAA
jgi:DNA-binding HxlR family transcriptional regulator